MGIVDPKALDIGEHQTTAWGEAAYAPWSAGWSCTCGESERRGSWDFDRAFEAAKFHRSEHKAGKANAAPKGDTVTDRPSLDHTLMFVARAWALRSTCSRLQVGAILVREGRPVAQGYNGPARGEPACRHDGDEQCRNSIHGEANALINAAKDGHATKGATLYVTHSPCWDCAGLAVNAEIAEVVYARPYRLSHGLDRLEAAGVKVRQFG